MTGFARFVIFLLLVIPICYVGASYMNGEDGIQKIKDKFNKEKTVAPSSDSNSGNVKVISSGGSSSSTYGGGTSSSSSSSSVSESELELKRELESLKKEVEELKRWKAEIEASQ